MASLSIGAAFRSGLGVVRRQPLSVAVWTALYLVVGLGPSLLLWFRAGPEYVDFFRQLVLAPSAFDPALMQTTRAKVGWLNNLSLFTSLVWIAVIGSAMSRAVLKPADSRWAYLRLGKTELFAGLLIVILYFGLIAVVLAVTFVAAIPITLIWMVSAPVGIAVCAIVAVVALLVISWIYARLLMALPMIVAESRFRLFEAWRLTRPAKWRVAVLVLAMTGIFLVSGLITLVVDLGAVAAVVGASKLDFAAFFDRHGSAIFHDLAPVLLVVTMVLTVLNVAIQIVLAGAWADAYRQLADDRPKLDEVFA